MVEDLMPFDLPVEQTSIIKVLGVGGGGSNAVNHMFRQGIKDVDFIVCNTDSQALINSPIPVKIQLGSSLTQGLGAGNNPENGRDAAIESIEAITEALKDNTKMIFITAGMGGGTGTGAAPVIAKATKELGILTVAIVTLPFRFEGPRRIRQAIEGISELAKNVDAMLVINNEKIREIYGNLPGSQAFSRADDVLTVAAKGIAEIITVHGYVNVDFADVKTVMSNSGVAVMGTGLAEGENRAINAVKNALNSPLLNNSDITGARNLLLNIVSGNEEVTMDEITLVNEFVQQASGNCADLIWGNTIDKSLGSKIAVTVIATGFETDVIPELYSLKKEEKKIHTLVLDGQKTKKEIPFEIEDVTKNPKKSDTFYDDDIDQNNDNLMDDDSDTFDVFGLNEEEIIPKKTKSKITAEETAQLNYERLRELQEKIANSKDKNFNVSSYKNIDDLENVPAYIRKKIKLDFGNKSKETEVSRYSLQELDEETILNSKNQYLYDNVD